MLRFAFAALLVLCALPPVRAAALEPGGDGVVREVIDGDTLLLDDGTEVRLVGIQAPKLPLGRPDFEPWPLADEAKQALEELALGRRVRLAYGGQERDRYGRALAHLYREDGLWLQGAMLSRGLARVYTFRDNIALAPELLAEERAARAAGRGIWAHEYYRVRDAQETPRFLDRFELVEGRVRDAAVVRGRLYLNFGENWREDFTVTVAPQDRRRFEEAGLTESTLEGRRIRVRGWLEEYNGPVIEATHPEQIEVLEQ